MCPNTRTGDRVSTRHNDRDLDVANRDTWTIATIGDGGSLALQGRRGARVVPATYARDDVELAYATTVYGAQGETTGEGHVALGEHTTASSAYVGMTRGRENNVAHLVATDIDDARRQWEEVFSRDRADLGPAHAARRAAEDVERYAPHRPLDVALEELRAAWTKEDQLRGAVRRATQRRNLVAFYGPETAERLAEIDVEIAEYRGLLDTARDQVRIRLHEPAIRSLPPGRLEQERTDWDQEHARARRAAVQQRSRAAERRHELDAGHRRTPDTGHGIGR